MKYDVKILVNSNIRFGLEQLAVSGDLAITDIGKTWTEYTLVSSDETAIKNFVVDAAVLYKDALLIRSIFLEK